MALSGQRPTAISLFTGTGGLDIGLEDAGFEMRCAVEWNNYACSSLRHNKVLATLPMVGFDSWFVKTTGDTYRRWEQERVERVKERVREGVGSHTYFVNSSIVEGDIRTISSEAILDAARTKVGELDLVAGGPPCQSFSRAGKRGSVEDERGQLFLEFVRIVRDARPRWFVFENVKGIILTKTTVWAVICNKCGYRGIPPFDVDRVEPNDADAAPNCTNCGGADTRWRVERNKREGALELILAEFRRIGYYCQYFVLNSVDFGVPQYRERLFIVGSRDNERIVVPSPTFVPGDRSHRSWGIETHPPQRTVWESLFTTPNRDHHWPINPEQAVLWVKNVVRPHDEPVTWSLLRPAPTIGAHQSAKLAVAPFGVPEEQLARQQWHVLGRRQGDTKPVPVDHTYLSDSDLLKLQSFPSYWFISGTRMERAFQIGNAVPPLLARQVGKAVLEGGAHVGLLDQGQKYLGGADHLSAPGPRQLALL